MNDREALVAPFRIYDDGSIGECARSITWDITRRNALLYWPKLALPRIIDNTWGNRWSIYDEAELQYLNSMDQIRLVDFVTQYADMSVSGTLLRVSNEYIQSPSSKRHNIVFNGIESQDDFNFNFLGADQEPTVARSSVSVNLLGMLPTPPRTATIQDIVEYKLKRSKEFSILHEEIDKLAFLFARPGDFQEGIRLAANSLRPIVEELDRYTTEHWGNRVLSSLAVHFGNFGTNVLSGAFVGSTFGVPLSGTLVGATKGVVEGIVKSAIQPKNIKDSSKPFAYCFFSGKL